MHDLSFNIVHESLAERVQRQHESYANTRLSHYWSPFFGNNNRDIMILSSLMMPRAKAKLKYILQNGVCQSKMISLRPIFYHTSIFSEMASVRAWLWWSME